MPILKELRAYLDVPREGPFGGQVRLKLLEAFDYEEAGIKLGTYGVITGAQNFIAGAVEKSEHAMEDFGFRFEEAVLITTDLGLETCWLGGTLTRGAFEQALDAGPNEVVPAVSPLGYARERRSMMDSMIRFMASSKKRKPFGELFFDECFGKSLTRECAGRYADVLEMVRLGPSASNRQPWRVVKDGGVNRFHFYQQRLRGYKKFSAVDLQSIDMGISMCHFELSARELELKGHWEFEAPRCGSLPERTSYIASWVE